MDGKVEYRSVREVRASEDGKTLYGRCVVYNQWSDLLFNHFRERISPGAFDKGMDRDIYASFNHDRNHILGRTSADTLKLTRSTDGIDVEVPVPDYSWAKDLVEAVRRRDLNGMSFIFDVKDDSWEMRDGVPSRTVITAEMHEVSFVYFPAYPQTEAGVRFALPVEGEKRAVERAISMDRFERCLRRQRLLEASLDD